MNQKFKASVNNKFNFELTGEDAISILKSDQPLLLAKEGQDTVKAEIVKEDFLNRKYILRINASVYEVHLGNELDILIDELGFTTDISSFRNDVKAPMPGVIVDVLAKPGDLVKTGDGLIVLEAMKMENTLTAPHDGIVKTVNVKKSDSVEKGTILIEFETDEKNK